MSQYNNIETELLADRWSLDRFNHCVWKEEHNECFTGPVVTFAGKRMAKYGVDIGYIQSKTNVMAAVLFRVSHIECSKGKQNTFG